MLAGDFPDRMRRILTTLEEAYRVPVDFEFAVNAGKLHVLQCRPLGNLDAGARHLLPERRVGGRPGVQHEPLGQQRPASRIIDYVVLIDPRDYARIESVNRRLEVGRVVGRVNDALADKVFMLMGPGRWGSQDLRLGVRVAFADIGHARVLVEIAREREGYVPEPSFGTHFFQELIEAAIHYLPLYPDDKDSVYNEKWLNEGPNALAEIVPGCADYRRRRPRDRRQADGPGPVASARDGRRAPGGALLRALARKGRPMTWTDTLHREIAYAYGAAAGLMKLVAEDELDYRPPLPEGAESTGWMTMGQLLHHMTQSCGMMCKAFEANDWTPVMGGEPGEMPAAASVETALEALEADRLVARDAIATAGEERMETERVTAPWGIEGTLGQQFLDSVKHLAQHKSQLFYYLKLLGRPVHTGHLWGMEE